jgi:hypothetical protein
VAELRAASMNEEREKDRIHYSKFQKQVSEPVFPQHRDEAIAVHISNFSSFSTNVHRSI